MLSTAGEVKDELISDVLLHKDTPVLVVQEKISFISSVL